MNRSRYLSAALLACLLLISAAAGAATAKQEVTVFYRQVGQGDQDWFYRQAELFSARSSRYEVNIVPAGSDYIEKLRTMMATATPMDMVVWAGPELAAEWVVDDLLVDVEALMRSDPAMSKDRYYQQMLEAGRIRGKVVFLTWSADPGLTMYNTEMMNDAGLASPLSRAESGSWTWDVFLEYAKRLTMDKNGDGTPEIYGYSPAWMYWIPNWYSWIASNGGGWVDVANRKALISQPAAYEALQWWGDLKNVHGVWGGDIYKGTAAMSTLFPSAAARMTVSARTGFAINPARRPGSEPVHYLVSAGAFLLKKGNVQGAWEFLKFLHSDESMRDFVNTTRRVPANKKAMRFWVESFSQEADGGEQAVQAIATGRAMPYQDPPVTLTRLQQLINPAIDKLVKNNASAQAITADLGRQIEAYMSEVLK